MEYREMQKKYLRRRQDEIWKTVRRLSRRSGAPMATQPLTEPTERPTRPDTRTEPEQ